MQIETLRLSLSRFEYSDVNALFSYASNPCVAKTTSWNPHVSVKDSASFIEFVNSRASLETGKVFWAWAIRKKEDSIAIGSIGFSQKSESEGRLDYALAESEWGKGIATEASVAIIDWAFKNLSGLKFIRSGGLSTNLASLRVMEKCRMRLEKRYRARFRKFNGEVREVTEYLITREEFMAICLES